VNVDSLPQSSYPLSQPKDQDSTLKGLHQEGLSLQVQPRTQEEQERMQLNLQMNVIAHECGVLQTVEWQNCS
jgi:hypothetical protein